MRNAKGSGKYTRRTEYTNPETAEITYSKPTLVDMRFSDKRGFLYKHTDNYIKRFNDSNLPDALSWSDQGKLSKLQTYIVGDSQLLGVRKNGRIVPLTISDICEIFKCKERLTYKTLKEAKKYGIVKKVCIAETLWYAYNPRFGLKDKRITICSYLIFQEELTDVIPDYVKYCFIKQAEDMPDKPIIMK